MNAAFVIFSAVFLALLWYDSARSHCTVCHRGYAVFSITGKLRRAVPACLKCWRTHRTFERNRLP